MKLYITAASVFVLIVFYLPLVLWVLWRIGRSPRWRGATKAGVMMLTLLLAYAIPLGDVTVNSIAMAKVCPSAGLHIYRTVEVEGFVGHYTVKDSQYRFIEFPTLRVDGTYYWVRSEKKPDGTISLKDLGRPTAEYEVAREQWHVDKERGIEASRYVVRNRLSGETLAEWNLFNSLPGWLDSILVHRWFGTGGQDGCHGEPAYGFERKVLIPKQSNN
ncbi:MAG: hypothetical protein PHF20_05820 [Halothiobacillaceae bacterium]|nr:hypothetical protein [Halothiobacillaceae bacterium]